MEQAPPAASAGTPSSSGSGPAPFLLKTYNMIDDSSTDDIVSWSSTNSSFVVWKPPEFSSRLLPTYFKHNNFSSFIRQLNTYGFHKIDPEKWEFANEDFVKGQKQLLKNIHRRKPIHSHSQVPADSERAALEEEIETLEKDKARLQADSLRFKHQHSAARVQLDDLEQRVRDMEQRQERLVFFLQRAVQNPKFVENIVKMAGTPDFFTPHGKRRLPGVDCCAEISESNSASTHNNNNNLNAAADAGGDLLNQELCDKLKLGLCPTFSDRREIDGCGILRIECLSSAPETIEHSDTGGGASFCPRKSSLLMAGLDDVNSGLLSCHLDLTLASSSMQNDRNGQLNRIPSTIDLDAADAAEQRTCNNASKEDTGIESSKEVVAAAAALPAAGRVNDKFWEQFLTERPGSSDTEEASSSLRGDEEEQEEEATFVQENVWGSNIKDMKHLSL